MRLRDGLRPSLYPELLEDDVDVPLDGARGDEQLGGNLRIREAGGDQLQHLPFARGEEIGERFARP